MHLVHWEKQLLVGHPFLDNWDTFGDKNDRFIIAATRSGSSKILQGSFDETHFWLSQLIYKPKDILVGPSVLLILHELLAFVCHSHWPVFIRVLPWVCWFLVKRKRRELMIDGLLFASGVFATTRKRYSEESRYLLTWCAHKEQQQDLLRSAPLAKQFIKAFFFHPPSSFPAVAHPVVCHNSYFKNGKRQRYERPHDNGW